MIVRCHILRVVHTLFFVLVALLMLLAFGSAHVLFLCLRLTFDSVHVTVRILEYDPLPGVVKMYLFPMQNIALAMLFCLSAVGGRLLNGEGRLVASVEHIDKVR